jgi:Leucine-rich repeat (LRR) protein
LDVSDNKIRIEQLANLTNLVELYIQFNQIDSLNISENMLPQLEKLHLSYNNIPANNLVALGNFRKLACLDLASNDLVTLPDSLEFLSSIEDLNLSSNQFSSDSTLVKPSKLFYAIGTIPSLKRLNLSRNKFSGFHYDDLNSDSFKHLQELDFSYNLVEDQNDLMY